jgi:hypothetical protein
MLTRTLNSPMPWTTQTRISILSLSWIQTREKGSPALRWRINKSAEKSSFGSGGKTPNYRQKRFGKTKGQNLNLCPPTTRKLDPTNKAWGTKKWSWNHMILTTGNLTEILAHLRKKGAAVHPYSQIYAHPNPPVLI